MGSLYVLEHHSNLGEGGHYVPFEMMCDPRDGRSDARVTVSQASTLVSVWPPDRARSSAAPLPAHVASRRSQQRGPGRSWPGVYLTLHV